MKELIEMNTSIMTHFYRWHFPTAKRKQSMKSIKQAWAAMYRWSLDADPCQVGRDEYYFFSTVSLEEFTRIFRDVEQIELEKRNHSPYTSTEVTA